MLLIETELAAGNRQVFRLGHGFGDLYAVFAAGAFVSVSQDKNGVVAHHGEEVRFFLIFFFERFDELLGGRIGIIRTVRAAVVCLVQRCFACDFDQLRAVPAVAAHHGNIQTDFTGLFYDLANFFIVTGNINRVRVLGFDFGQTGFEVHIFCQIGFFRNDLAFEVLFERISQAFGVITGVVAVNRNVLNFQFPVGKSCHYFALERIDEAGTENELTDFACLGVKRNSIRSSSRRYGRKFISCNDRFRSHGAAAGSRSYKTDQFVLGNQFRSRIAGFGRLRLIVGFYDTQFFAVDTAGFVDLVNRHFAAGQCRLAIACYVAGQFIVSTDQGFRCFVVCSFFVAAATAAACRHHCQQNSRC